jgi:hypothetical protein
MDTGGGSDLRGKAYPPKGEEPQNPQIGEVPCGSLSEMMGGPRTSAPLGWRHRPNSWTPPDSPKRSGSAVEVEPMKTILMTALLLASTATAALAQQATIYCNPYSNVCTTTYANGQTSQTYTNPYSHTSTTYTPAGTYQTYTNPYSNTTNTYGPNGTTASTYYNPYSHTSTTYNSPSGTSYNTYYNQYSNTTSTYGSNGYQQHCYVNTYSNTVQCY